jgi:hypothetical protein
MNSIRFAERTSELDIYVIGNPESTGVSLPRENRG